MTIVRKFGFILLMFLATAAISLAQAAPRVFFTDLDSGPNTGGENNRGTILTIYGKNFGATQGASTVTIGGNPVAAYLQWNGTVGDGRMGLQKIAVAIGSGVTGTSLPIVVTVNGQASNNDVPFTVRSGNIYCVSITGNDANNGKFTTATGGTGCFRTLQKARDSMAAGDISYVLNGFSATTEEAYHATFYLSDGGGASGRNVAYVGYPGATATIGDPSYVSGYIEYDMAISISAWTQSTNYITLANLTLRARRSAIGMQGVGHRIVGNDISCPNSVNNQDGCVATFANNGAPVYFYGNYIHDISNGSTTVINSVTKLYHAMYMDAGSNHYYVAWNEWANSKGDRGLQIYNSTAAVYDIHIHDNLFHDIRGNCMTLAETDPSRGPVEVYNNVLDGCGQGPDFTDGGGTPMDCIYKPGSSYSSGSGNIEVYNNTLHSCGSNNDGKASPGAAFDCGSGGPSVRYRNNVVYTTTGSYADLGCGVCDTNLFYGVGSAPGACTNNKNVDPLFVNRSGHDFHLQTGSAAIGSGLNLGLLVDFDGTARPVTGAPSLGAFEPAPSGTVQRPNPPTNLRVTVQ